MLSTAAVIQPVRFPSNNQNNFLAKSSSFSSPSSSASPDSDPRDDHNDDPDINTCEYDYPRPLRRASSGLANGFGFDFGRTFSGGVSLPQSVLVSGGDRGYRSMSMSIAETMTMGNVSLESVDEVEVPSSPPGLSYSKSSKSSSSNSDDDYLSDPGLTEKLSHFDEVVLDDGEPRDSGDDCNQPPASRPTLRRPPSKPRSTREAAVTGRRRSGTSPMRPLPNGSRQKYPSLKGAVNGALGDQSLNLPNGRSMNRSFSSPNSPFVRHQQRIPSRSPSPRKSYTTPTQSLGGATPKASFEASKENSLARRTSWQPGRRSVKELEAECDDDDEDVPEEAILENVPISPLPGHYTSYQSPSTTSLRSATPSPHRRPSYANLHSAKIPRQAKRPSAPPVPGSHPRSPNNVSRPPLQHSATISSFPGDPNNRKFRSLSWTEDLSQEARHLSQALEEYAEKLSTEKRVSAGNTPSSSPPRPDLSKARTRTSVTEFPCLPTIPAVQKGNIMIDPLPVSKEKEAVLTRTRPSWLPPKSQKEEKKHLKEFQQMMARAADAEKRRVVREQEDRENLEEMQGSIARIWDQHVLADWDVVVREPRTRELWWRGVTARSRGEVWQRAIGNELELSATTFDAALSRANMLETKYLDTPAEERAKIKEAAWLDSIARDVPNVYPELQMYWLGGQLHESLSNVLKAYSFYRGDVGYVYGTHLVAGIVCLLLPAPEAFVLLANILNRPLPLAFLVHDQVAMARAYHLTLSTLKYKFTKLHDHLTNPNTGLRAEEFLDPIFRCMFAYNMSHEHVSRVWDVFVFEGDKALIRAAVAILARLESQLYGSREEILEVIGWRNERRWDLGTEEEFMQAMREAGKADAKGETVISV